MNRRKFLQFGLGALSLPFIPGILGIDKSEGKDQTASIMMHNGKIEAVSFMSGPLPSETIKELYEAGKIFEEMAESARRAKVAIINLP